MPIKFDITTKNYAGQTDRLENIWLNQFFRNIESKGFVNRETFMNKLKASRPVWGGGV